MTTHRTDEKKPARGGFWRRRELEKPRLRRVVQLNVHADYWPVHRTVTVLWECSGMGCGTRDPSAYGAYMAWRIAVGPLTLREWLDLRFSPWKLEWSGWDYSRPY